MFMHKITSGEPHPAPPPGLSPPVGAAGLSAAFAAAGATMRYRRGAEVFGEGEAAEYFYQVGEGAIRSYKLLTDGRRQIASFHLAGDFFGLEASEAHRFSAEAIADTTVRFARRSAIIAEAAADGDLARELWITTAGSLARAQDHMLLLGRKTAEERVATFLLEMAGRFPAGATVELPMSRQDIADYLGLTIETVSRTLTHLQASRAIELPSSRRIRLRNRAALQRLYS
jgi:CRP/FNR family nitrogen fixation transcriptional regulator